MMDLGESDSDCRPFMNDNTKFSNPYGKSDIIQVSQGKFMWMKEYCAEYMNIIGLFGGRLEDPARVLKAG